MVVLKISSCVIVCSAERTPRWTLPAAGAVARALHHRPALPGAAVPRVPLGLGRKGGSHTPHRVNTMMELFHSCLSVQNTESP
jgi:hypothetical protein